MKRLYEFWPFNFGALRQQDFTQAKAVIVPIPYEATTSNGSGTRSGPYYIIESSRYLEELYSQKAEGAIEIGAPTDIYTLDEVDISRNSVPEALKGIESVITEEVVKHGKIPIVLGGEHTISYGVVRALRRRYKKLSVLHFDAHTDSLPSYEGSRFGHACIIRRIRELGVPVVSVGVRDYNKEGLEYLERNRIKSVYFMPGLPAVAKVLRQLSHEVYVTFDVDSLDPSIMPAVGTPEPGGLAWYETIELIKAVSQKVRIIGADVVELAPIPGFEAPNFLAAKLTYTLLAVALKSIKN